MTAARRTKSLVAVCFVALGVVATCRVAAAQTVASRPNLRDGALRGRVVDVETGLPISGALVALRDNHEETLAWTRTDATGQYTLNVPALKTLQLQGRRKGIFSRVLDAGVAIVSAPVEFVHSAMHSSPADVARMMITGAIGGPIAIGGMALGRLKGAAMGQVSRAVSVGMAEDNGTIDIAGMPMRSVNGRTRAPGTPGGVMLSVSAPQYRELPLAWAGAYWITPATGNGAMGAQAFLEPVELAKPSSLRASGVHPTAIQLSDLTVGSTLVPAGDTVPVSVKLNCPNNAPLPIRIFARSSVGGAVAELTPVAGSPGWYGGTLPISARAGSSPGLVSVVALHAEPIDTPLPTDKQTKIDPLLAAAARLNGLNGDKSFEFDPCVFAAENRLDAAITVLGRKQQSPTPTTANVAEVARP